MSLAMANQRQQNVHQSRAIRTSAASQVCSRPHCDALWLNSAPVSHTALARVSTKPQLKDADWPPSDCALTSSIGANCVAVGVGPIPVAQCRAGFII